VTILGSDFEEGCCVARQMNQIVERRFVDKMVKLFLHTISVKPLAFFYKKLPYDFFRVRSWSVKFQNKS
jgi:hypothetical protein